MSTQRPFDGTPNPEAYVPRNATNRCLFDLEDWVFHGGPSVALLAGPSGIGKTQGIKLKPGDLIRAEIEGIGVLENTVVAPAAVSP